jgi:hypothetical protein
MYISSGASPAVGTARKSAWIDFAIAGNSTEESATGQEAKVINENPLTKFDSWLQTNYGSQTIQELQMIS